MKYVVLICSLLASCAHFESSKCHVVINSRCWFDQGFFYCIATFENGDLYTFDESVVINDLVCRDGNGWKKRR